MRNIQVPAYWPAVLGVQDSEKRGVLVLVKKFIDIDDMDMGMDVDMGIDIDVDIAMPALVVVIGMFMFIVAVGRCFVWSSFAKRQVGGWVRIRADGGRRDCIVSFGSTGGRRSLACACMCTLNVYPIHSHTKTHTEKMNAQMKSCSIKSSKCPVGKLQKVEYNAATKALCLD